MDNATGGKKIKFSKKIISYGISIILLGMVIYLPIRSQIIYNENQPESLKRQERILQDITTVILPYQAEEIVIYRKATQDYVVFSIPLPSEPEKNYLESIKIIEKVYGLGCTEKEQLSVDGTSANHILKITWIYPDDNVKCSNKHQ